MSLHCDNPKTACAHDQVRLGGIVECVICKRHIARQRCPACMGSGQFAGRGGDEDCEECDGTGDGEWEVVQ